VVLGLSACATEPSHEQTGQVVGGMVGSQFGDGSGHTAATLLGVLAGAAIGGKVGRDMDDKDRRRAAQALETAPTGRATKWVNPDSGHEFSVTPTRTWAGPAGPCRDYTLDTRSPGSPGTPAAQDSVRATACRQGDGNWKVQETSLRPPPPRPQPQPE
jgi:surface antigen